MTRVIPVIHWFLLSLSSSDPRYPCHPSILIIIFIQLPVLSLSSIDPYLSVFIYPCHAETRVIAVILWHLLSLSSSDRYPCHPLTPVIPVTQLPSVFLSNSYLLYPFHPITSLIPIIQLPYPLYHWSRIIQQQKAKVRCCRLLPVAWGTNCFYWMPQQRFSARMFLRKGLIEDQILGGMDYLDKWMTCFVWSNRMIIHFSKSSMAKYILFFSSLSSNHPGAKWL